MKAHHLIWILILLLKFNSHAQDTLLFKRVKGSDNNYKLPLGKFPVEIKLVDSLDFKAIIEDQLDSMLSIRVYGSKTLVNEEIKKIRKHCDSLLKVTKYTKHQKDSVDLDLKLQIARAEYSKPIQVKISRIKWITVNNYYIPSKQKPIKLIKAACAVSIIGTLISSTTRSPYIIGSGVALTAACFLAKQTLTLERFDLILSKKNRIKKQWMISKKTN